MRTTWIIILLCITVSLIADNTDWLNYNSTNTAFPDNGYKSIAIDRNSNKWIGTEYRGLFLYDGANWKVYNTGNSSLPSNVINSLFYDKNNYLWIATSGGGLVRKDSLDHWTIFNRTNSGIPSNDVSTVMSDSVGQIWVGTRGGGLAVMDSQQNWTTYTTSNSYLPHNEIVSLYREVKNSEEILWVGTYGGLVRIKNGTWMVYNTDNSDLPGNSIVSIVSDTQSNVWFATYNPVLNEGAGLVKLDTTNVWTIYNRSNSNIPSNNVYAIQIERNTGGDIKWVATDQGLAKLSGSAWTLYTTQTTANVLPSNIVLSISITGNVKWIGTKKGLARYSGTNWTSLSITNSGIPSNQINCIASYLSGNSSTEWFGTSVGLSRFDGTSWTIWQTNNSNIPSNDVRALAFENNSTVWIGTAPFYYAGGGLAKLDMSSNNWEVYTVSNSELPHNQISALAIDVQMNKWIGTVGGGLAVLSSTGEWQIYKETNSLLPSNNVKVLYYDRIHTLWVATDFGLASIDSTGIWTIYNTFNSGLTSNNILSITRDLLGAVWVGTDNGLSRLYKGSWQTYTTTSSLLAGNIINAIQTDKWNNIWVGTNAGLCKLTDLDWTIYTKTNSLLVSNSISCMTILDIDGTHSWKWIGTQDAGISVYKGSNNLYNKGIYMSIAQNSVLNNIIEIMINTMQIIPDSISLTANSTHLTTTNIGNNTWSAHYELQGQGMITITCKVFYEGRDSTITRVVSPIIINNKGGFGYLPNHTIALTINPNTMQDSRYMLIEEAGTNAGDTVYQIKSCYKDLMGFFTAASSQIRSVKFSTNCSDWEEQQIDETTNTAHYCGSGFYRFQFDEAVSVTPRIESYPNPFNPSVTIELSIPLKNLNTESKVVVYNSKGQRIKTLYCGIVTTEKGQLHWDGLDEAKKAVATGVYFVSLSQKGKTLVCHKLLLMK